MRNDNIYYNVRIQTPTNDTRVELNETRVVPILDKPNEYELAVERFFIPTTNIPIMIFKDDYYFVSFSYNGTTITKSLKWIPNTTGQDLYGNSIWNYQEFLDILNQAFLECFTDLKTAEPGWSATNPPFMSFDPETQLFFHNFPVIYSVNMDILFSVSLYQLFNSFVYIYQTNSFNKEYKLKIADYGNNEITINGNQYLSTYGEWITLSTWNDLQSIVFETNSIPINPEFEQGQINKTQKIITDFEPIQNINDRTAFQYFPQGPLRYYDLYNDKPLYTINISVLWKDKNNNLYPFYINKNELLTIKLLFKKKERYLE